MDKITTPKTALTYARAVKISPGINTLYVVRPRSRRAHSTAPGACMGQQMMNYRTVLNTHSITTQSLGSE